MAECSPWLVPFPPPTPQAAARHPCSPVSSVLWKKGKKKGKRPVAPAGGPGFRGTVTYKGQPVPAGDVLLVSLDRPRPIVIAAAIQDNGQYAPMAVVPPGKYVVIVAGKHIPAKYHLTTTSGLEIEVTQPPTVFDINLN